MTGIFTKETLVKGRPVQLECLEIEGQTYTLSRGFAQTLRLEDEWYEDLQDPASIIASVKASRVKADILTFWQRLPDIEPRFPFYREWETIAALPVRSFDHWWNRQIKSRTRNLIRKAEKSGIEVRQARYDEDFVRGMTDIFNETPVRQGRRFWHYGKDCETVRRQFCRYLFREDLIGAYYRGELIGFVMLGDAKRYAVTGQIISKIQHRDKATNNLLISKAVEICEQKNFPYLVYFHWSDDSLAEFKRRCGFEPTRVPRYYVPLTGRGRLILRLGWHRDWKEQLPRPVKGRLKALRARWLDRYDDRGRTGCQE
jgi:hypothetical protein